MRHLRLTCYPSIDFFSDSEFHDFKRSLDAEMKRLQGKGIGSSKRQAEILTREEEDKLWREGLLGDTTPQQLLDTLIFYNGLYFALRSGREHRQLRLHPCQIQLIEIDGERSYLKYTEDTSKNRPGGLKGRKMKPKVVIQYSNSDNPEKCIVRLFKKYTSLCPDEATALYLQPANKPTDAKWYTSKPLGHNTLSKTISRLCKSAGIEGFKTNHSLRATAATRLYELGVDEQMVMERTGHRSLEGVRSYKRTTSKQQQDVSDLLSNKIVEKPTNQQLQMPPHHQQQQMPPHHQQQQIHPHHKQLHNTSSIYQSPNSLKQQQLTTLCTETASTNISHHSNTTNCLPGHSFAFNSCSSVTFNINYN